MNATHSRPAPIAIAIAIAFFLIAVITGCGPKAPTALPPGVEYYTCSMHPSVHLFDPKAKCPICGMNLIPVMQKQGTNTATTHEHTNAEMTASMEASNSAPSEFNIPVSRQQMIGVTYDAVSRKPLRFTVRAAGVVAYDKQRHWDYVARVEGYVQTLNVFSRGETVTNGKPLMTIYSPELLTSQKEFLDLLRMRDDAKREDNTHILDNLEKMTDASRDRLRRWNLTTNQVTELEKTRTPREGLTFVSPFDGVVQSLRIDQGGRFMVGDHLVDIADLSTVWVWTEFYQDDLPFLKPGLNLEITSTALPGKKLQGTISVVDPFMDPVKRTVRVRADVPNQSLELRPDMFVDVELALDLGESLTIPVSSVIPTGKRYVVFVDKGEGKLEPRFIEIGRKVSEDYTVTAGLKEGERIVTSANFLIDAESKIQGAIKTW